MESAFDVISVARAADVIREKTAPRTVIDAMQAAKTVEQPDVVDIDGVAAETRARSEAYEPPCLTAQAMMCVDASESGSEDEFESDVAVDSSARTAKDAALHV